MTKLQKGHIYFRDKVRSWCEDFGWDMPNILCALAQETSEPIPVDLVEEWLKGYPRPNILVIDDLEMRFRSIKRQFGGDSRRWSWASSMSDALLTLRHAHRFDVMFFDFDLGHSEDEKAKGWPPSTGEDVAKWIISSMPEKMWPSQVIVHSMDSVGKNRVAAVWRDVGVAVDICEFSDHMAG